MENESCIGDVPINTSIHRAFSIAMFDYQRVFGYVLHILDGDITFHGWGVRMFTYVSTYVRVSVIL